MDSSNKKGRTALVIILIVVILALVWCVATKNKSAEDETATTTTPIATSTDVSLEGDMIDAIIIVYGTNGFSPETITINKGQTVRWVNQSNMPMWIASTNDATHTGYPGSATSECGTGSSMFNQCVEGNTFSFTFNETGTWAYHNHSRNSDMGTIVVE
jgi:plastocyanin